MTRRVLVVHAHPDPTSFSRALFDHVGQVCREVGNEVRVHDLYGAGFSAAMSANEWSLRGAAPSTKPHLVPYFEDVAWCDTLVFVYPTWWSGQPAILKAWIDRVLANGVAWKVDESTGHVMPRLRNVTRIIVVATHGRSRGANLWCGRAGRTAIVRSIRRLCSWRCRAHWLALHAVDRSTRFERDRFMQRVERVLRRIS
ncbi:MAG: NAD(P)H-dependent oxidoreductase [Actinobacteria bacterium]|nr:NAD(P)H-dependent oxidoreductase [Actinomycetota bacterium]